MGLYQKDVFKKDKNGKWKKVKSTIEKSPHDVGRWSRSNEFEKRSSLGEKTFLNIAPTRGGLNEKVVQARTYFGDEKVVRTLITTSNKLPKTKRK